MESFTKWGKEKRQLDELFGLPAAAIGASMAINAGIAHYLWQKGRKKKEQRSDWWVFNKRAKPDEGETEVKAKVFSGVQIVQMVRTNELDLSDLVWPPGAQNWISIKDAKKLLPFNRVNKGKAKDDTIWWAWIDGKAQKYEGSPTFAKAIAKREVKPETLVRRHGYDEWIPYKSKDVQDDIHKYVANEPPSLGNQELIGATTYYLLRGKQQGPIKFEDLVGVQKKGMINDESHVWVQGFRGKQWVKFKEVRDKLPSVGQAHVSNPRGLIGKTGKFLGKLSGGLRSRAEKDDGYINAANVKDRTPTPV